MESTLQQMGDLELFFEKLLKFKEEMKAKADVEMLVDAKTVFDRLDEIIKDER